MSLGREGGGGEGRGGEGRGGEGRGGEGRGGEGRGGRGWGREGRDDCYTYSSSFFLRHTLLLQHDAPNYVTPIISVMCHLC